MARTITLGEARTALKELLGIQNDSHFSDNELNRHIATAAAETWDLLVNSGLAEQFVKSVTFNSVANQMEYTIEPTLISANDFYKVHNLYVVEGSHLRPIPRINPAEITFYKAPPAVQQMKLYYIPMCITFKTAGVYNDALTFEGFNGWEEHVIVSAGIKVKTKQQDDFNQLFRQKKDLEQRIQSMANTDWSQPSRVVRRYNQQRYNNRFFPFTGTVTAWGLRGGKLELYSNDTHPYV